MSTLRTEHITKDYPGCRALDDVSLSFDSGRVHALLGKNGSGKSTMVKIFSGAIRPTKGEFFLDGEKLSFSSPSEANNRGLATVYQEMSLIPSLSVTENIFLGRLPRKLGGRIVDWAKANRMAKELLDRMGVDISPTERVSRLSMWQWQVVEITKAMSCNPKVLMLDEPTSSLAQHEVELLFSAVRALKQQDVIIIYITHKLQEIPAIADTVTVLRDGKLIGKADIEEVDAKGILNMMFGDVAIRTRPDDVVPGEKVVMRVEHFSHKGKFEDINFTLHEGEVLGIAGMLGSGRTELLRALFGADTHTEGTVEMDGEQIEGRLTPALMKKHGLGLTPENRKTDGLVLSQSILDNLSFASIRKNSRGWLVDHKRRKASAEHQVESLQIKIPGLETFVSALSGGNQQKVVIGNWLSNNPRVMLYDEPTRGIDVNAKQQIFEIMWAGTHKGIATIFVSSELEELLETCNRILIMRQGRMIGEVDPETTKIDDLYSYCMEGMAQ